MRKAAWSQVGSAVGIALAVGVGLILWSGERQSAASPGVTLPGRTLPPEFVETRPALASAPVDVRPIRAVPIETSASAIRGQVVDASGAPVAGAQVVAVRTRLQGNVEIARGGALPEGATACLTGARGDFACEPAGATSTLVVDARGFARWSRADVEAATEVHATLVPSLDLVGHIIDRDGNPIPNARVSWSASVDGVKTTAAARAGGDGTYELRDIASDRPMTCWELMVVADGFAPRRFGSLSGGVWRGGERTFADRTLRRDWVLFEGRRIEGRVVDFQTHVPVQAARVFILGQRDHERADANGRVVWAPWILAETGTNAEGSFTVDHVPEDPETVRPALGVLALAPSGAVGQALVVLRNGPAPVQVAVTPTATVRGRVVDAEGRPVEEVRVAAQFGSAIEQPVLDGTGRRLDALATRTDAAGRYVIDRLDASRFGMGLLFASSDRVSLQKEMFKGVAVAPGESLEMPDVVVEPRPVVRCEVVDGRGLPIAGARCSWTYDTRLRALSADADASGRCILVRPRLFDDEPSIEVYARARGFALAKAKAVREPGKWLYDLRLVLEPGRTLTGELVHPDGTPAERWTVMAANAELPLADAFAAASETPINTLDADVVWWGATESDRLGRFALPNLPMGRVHVAAMSDRWSRPTARLSSVAASTIRIDVGPRAVPEAAPPDPRARIEIRVVDESTKVIVADAQAKWVDAKGTSLASAYLADGRIVFESVIPRSGTVAVTSTRHKPWTSATIDAKAGGSIGLVAELQRN